MRKTFRLCDCLSKRSNIASATYSKCQNSCYLHGMFSEEKIVKVARAATSFGWLDKTLPPNPFTFQPSTLAHSVFSRPSTHDSETARLGKDTHDFHVPRQPFLQFLKHIRPNWSMVKLGTESGPILKYAFIVPDTQLKRENDSSKKR